jgi:hypothetical protein
MIGQITGESQAVKAKGRFKSSAGGVNAVRRPSVWTRREPLLSWRGMSIGCATGGWSAVTSSPANSALAGVLAGFMFGGIVLLLGQSATRQRLQAMSLLFSAFVVLGLDSYLFGLVTGDTSACRREWTEAMMGAGLLGVGAVAIVSALGLLLTSYIAEPATAASQDHAADLATSPEAKLLRVLTSVLLYGAVAVVVFILTVVAEDYLNAVFNTHPPRWLADPVYAYAALPLAGLLGLRVLRRWRKPGTSASGTLLAVATITGGGYAVLGVVLASLAASFPVHDWFPIPTWVAIATTVIGLLVPVPIFVALVATVPTSSRA